MSHLRMISVPLTDGVVSKVTTEGQGSETWVTVETFRPDEKKAYRFLHPGPNRPKKGDAVIFTGKAKVEHYRGRPRYAKYYHDPMDGTPKADWEFADLVEASCVHVGRWDLIRATVRVEEDVKDIVRRSGCYSSKDLSKCLLHARAYVRALEAQVSEARESEGVTGPVSADP